MATPATPHPTEIVMFPQDTVFPQDTRTSIRGSMRAGNVSEGLSWREYQIVESIRVSQGYWLMQELDSWVPVELVVDASIGAEQRAT